MIGASDYLVEEYCSAILHDNMDISRMMVHAQKVEATRIKRENSEFKRSKSYKEGISNSRPYIHEKSRFDNMVSDKISYNLPKAKRDRICNPKSQKA